MAARRRVSEIAMSAEELQELGVIARSRSEATCRVRRARMLLAFDERRSLYAAGRAVGVTP